MTARDNEGSSQRQWQRERTVAAIEHAALPVFARLGYEATTAEHLAEAAGVSVRTLFRYFPSGKDDVILAELRRSLDGLEHTIRSQPAGVSLSSMIRTARDQWRQQAHAIEPGEAAKLTTQIASEQPELMARLLSERQLLAERLVDVFGERLGLDPVSDLRPRLFAHCFVAALVTGYVSSLARPDADGAALVDEAIAAITPLFESVSRPD